MAEVYKYIDFFLTARGLFYQVVLMDSHCGIHMAWHGWLMQYPSIASISLGRFMYLHSYALLHFRGVKSCLFHHPWLLPFEWSMENGVGS